MRGLSAAIGMGIIFVLIAGMPVLAYQYVGGSQNCQQCHTDYTSGSDWHNLHTNLVKDDCAKCHDAQQQVPAANCKACHSGLPCTWVNTHTEQGTQTCMTCHAQCQPDDENCPASTCLGRNDPHIKTLQAFRDNVLAKSAAGRALIRAYYVSGDAVNKYFETHPEIKATAAEMLLWFAGIVEPLVGK